MPAATARRLLLVLAAITALTLASVSSALAASGPQNGVRAFTPAAPSLIGLRATESSCSRPGSVDAGAELASGFCVATEEPRPGEPSTHSTLRGGERGIEPSEVTQNSDLYFDSESGNKVYVLGAGGGESEVVIQSPDGTDITTYRISDTTLQNRLNSGQWLDPNG